MKKDSAEKRCPTCGGPNVVVEMWGWVNPATGKYVRRLYGFRWDTLIASAVMFSMGVIYLAFYLVAIPVNLVWRLFTHRRYLQRRYEYVCKDCGFDWEADVGPEMELGLAEA
jgi:hypothetical protein